MGNEEGRRREDGYFVFEFIGSDDRTIEGDGGVRSCYLELELDG